MRIINKTSGTSLTDHAIQTKNVLEKAIGLIGKEPQTLILRTHFGIHTFGMNYPIDVLVINKHHRVVALKEKLKPNRIFLWNPKYDFIIELPKGTIEKTHTELGDTLSVIASEK